jgi:sterol desaturase/sphingolipid hydroxylase (fatty acid hydroxylase superfamily)
VTEQIIEGFSLPLDYLMNPTKRIYWLYLLTSVIITYCVYLLNKSEKAFIRYMMPRKVWLSKSTFVDAALTFVNGLVKVLLIGPYFVFGFALSESVEETLVYLIGYPSAPLSETSVIILYTVVLTLIMDFSTYIVHFLMHRIPVLWEFHKIHHAATVLSPITQYRIHPVELLLNNVKAIAVMGLVTGIFTYLSPHPISELSIMGANAFSFVFLFFGANLRHSHIELKYPAWLENFLISPFQHQIHHSDNPLHFDKNLGSKFAIWDKIFGTLIQSNQVKSIKYGIGVENDQYDSLLQNLLNPFWKCVRRLLVMLGVCR